MPDDDPPDDERRCPTCQRPLSWRNVGARCSECRREYCKECPDFRWGRFEIRCPDCGCRTAVPLRAAESADPA